MLHAILHYICPVSSHIQRLAIFSATNSAVSIDFYCKLSTERLTTKSRTFASQSCLDGGRLLFQWPLPQGLASLADEDFAAALEAQMADIRGQQLAAGWQRVGPGRPHRPEPEGARSQPAGEVRQPGCLR